MKIKTKSSHGPRRWPPGWLTLPALGAIGAAAFLFINSQNRPAPSRQFRPDTTCRPGARTGSDGQYLLQLADGELPPAGVRTFGVVLSDTNCEPDAQGLNHCRNGIRLADGSTINLIDNHMMSRYRCLQPGETVSLTTFDDAWVVALTAEAGTAQ